MGISGLNQDQSRRWFEEAQSRMPGGVNSPVRAFRAVEGDPPFIHRGEGCFLWDVDGNRYIDYLMSWGALILGHVPPRVQEALAETLTRGTSFGAPTPLEVEMARRVQEAYPLLERVRMVNSGTEAVMSALRLARAYTGRTRIVKFEGCYHGHSDGLLVQAGSGATTLGVPTSPGVPEDYTRHTLVAPFNDLDAVRNLLEAHRGEVAAVIVEPVPGNMGVVLPHPGFLEGLQRLCREHGSLLIFDEVITGFRVSRGGAQERYQVQPDLTCLGKIIGGGLPVGAFGGRREILDLLAPEGPVYQAGTLSGNPLAMTAGVATLDLLRDPEVYTRLEHLAQGLEEGLRDAARRAGVEVFITRVASMLCVFFHPGPVIDYATARATDTRRFARFHRGMLERGIYLPPSQFEAWFLSTAHTEEVVAQTVAQAYEVFRGL